MQSISWRNLMLRNNSGKTMLQNAEYSSPDDVLGVVNNVLENMLSNVGNLLKSAESIESTSKLKSDDVVEHLLIESDTESEYKPSAIQIVGTKNANGSERNTGQMEDASEENEQSSTLYQPIINLVEPERLWDDGPTISTIPLPQIRLPLDYVDWSADGSELDALSMEESDSDSDDDLQAAEHSENAGDPDEFDDLNDVAFLDRMFNYLRNPDIMRHHEGNGDQPLLEVDEEEDSD